jgi:hypothetical protein
MKEPGLVTATQEELDEILRRVRPSLPQSQYRLLEGVLATFVYARAAEREDVDQALPAHVVRPSHRAQAQRA